MQEPRRKKTIFAKRFQHNESLFNHSIKHRGFSRGHAPVGGLAALGAWQADAQGGGEDYDQ